MGGGRLEGPPGLLAQPSPHSEVLGLASDLLGDLSPLPLADVRTMMLSVLPICFLTI